MLGLLKVLVLTNCAATWATVREGRQAGEQWEAGAGKTIHT